MHITLIIHLLHTYENTYNYSNAIINNIIQKFSKILIKFSDSIPTKSTIQSSTVNQC